MIIYVEPLCNNEELRKTGNSTVGIRVVVYAQTSTLQFVRALGVTAENTFELNT